MCRLSPLGSTFPFLFGGAFIEAAPSRCRETEILAISLQLVGTFNKTRLL